MMTSRSASCVDPSAIRPEDLVAYAYGEAGAAVIAHVQRCPACRDEAAVYARLDATLSARLFRRGCPEAIVIGEYASGFLTGDAQWQVASHLKECPYCLAESRDFRDFLATPDQDMTPGLVAETAGGIAGALRRILAQPFAPPATALAGLRGGSDPDTTTYTAAGMRLTVSVQRGGQGSRRSVLVGLIEQGSGALAGARAQLFEGAQLLQTENVDELGNFLFANVSPGVYRIEVTIPHAIVEIDPVRVP